jgi:hypothetical protein
VDPGDRRMSGRFHLLRDCIERLDHVRNVVEALASFGQPVRVDARTVERLDQLVLRAAVVQRQSQRPLGRLPAVLATFSLGAEHPPTPRPGREPRVELAHGALELAHDEGDLKRRESFERADDARYPMTLRLHASTGAAACSAAAFTPSAKVGKT